MRRHQSFAGQTLRTRELPDYSLAETVYPAGWEMPRHEHDAAYFSLVLQGGYDESYGARSRSCQPASLVFHPPGEDHAVVFHQERVRIFRVQVKTPFLARVRECTTILDSPSAFDGGATAQLATRLYHEAQARDAVAPLAIEALVLEVLTAAARQQETTTDARLPIWLARARDLLHEYCHDEWTLSEVARTVGVHPIYLARIFRQHFHCSVGEYVRRLRIEHACQQMMKTEASLVEIAHAVGFYDQSHFTRTFKRITGMTPAEFRTARQR
jgi:AraC family transcriptional regulator